MTEFLGTVMPAKAGIQRLTIYLQNSEVFLVLHDRKPGRNPFLITARH